jgi:hypothetical protein
MKKAVSLLLAALLILSLSAVCWADSPRPAETSAQTRQFAASLKAELRGDEAAAAAHPGTVTPSYSRTYTRQRTSPLAKAIAAGIIGAFVGLFKAITGKGKKKDAGSQSGDTAAGANGFICRSCGKTRAGWYQVCPDCGAAGTMVRLTVTDAKTDPQPGNEAAQTPKPSATVAQEPVQGPAPEKRFAPPEDAQSSTNSELAALLTYALRFQTDSGMRDYLQRNASRLAPEEKARLDDLLNNGDPTFLRARAESLLDFLCQA